MATALSRRELFTRWMNVATRALDAASEEAPRRSRVPERNLLPEFLRPPGAADEKELLALCERCGKCREACPYDVILPLGPAYGDAEGTPAILPRGGPCHLCEDLACAAACPSGALKPCAIEDVRMGTARLDAALCWAANGQPCDYCVKECPLGEKAIRWNRTHPEIVADGCAGCGMCVYICPAPGTALSVERHAHTVGA